MVLMAEPLMKAIDYSFELLSSEIEDLGCLSIPSRKRWDQEAQDVSQLKTLFLSAVDIKG